MQYDVIIGFETHVELKTASKLFCSCAVTYGAPQNSQICPVCTGQPGALPVLNQRAVEYSIRAGLALNCKVNLASQFARKNYFYPDLPKGYQISQYENPFCENGYLNIFGDDGEPYAVGIKRIHLEEDAGKMIHASEHFDKSSYSLVDYNRSGVPLLEIVGDHERNPIRSVQEARSYLEKLRQILRYTEISDCNIEKGQFRCDVNISLRSKGSKTFGNRAEIKNMSSIKFIMEALEYEVNRQKDILQSGGQVVQETRLFDEKKKITLPMRSKEDAPDYRYFPDPDLIEVELKPEFIENIRNNLPVFPDERIRQLMETYRIPQDEAMVLTRDKGVADYFNEAAVDCQDHRRLARYVVNDLLKLLHEASVPIERLKITPSNLAQLINLVSNGEITDNIGKIVLEEMFQSGSDPQTIIHQKDLKPIQDSSTLESLLDKVLAKNPQAVELVKSGKTGSINFIIGKVMAETKGKANPQKLREMLEKKLIE
jgi:aspartyl-tRNA(Asn)/glutamyl-tRNA(Gln) amidotransferase subunit B